MDYNLAFSCIGYGAVRVLRERKVSSTDAPFALPANSIMNQADPVGFCIEALKDEHPDWVEKIDEETRLAIHSKLRDEARRGRAN